MTKLNNPAKVWGARLPLGGCASTTATLVTWGASSLSLFVERLTPLLTPEQRARLAQRMRESSRQPVGEAMR